MGKRPTEKDLIEKIQRLESQVSNASHSEIDLIREIRRRKRIETALRNSEERYRAVVEDQTELIARHSPAYEMEFVNGALARYFSTSPEALVGKSFLPLLHAADRERVEAFYSSLTRESPIGTDEHRVLLENGEMRWHQWNVRALFDETGKRTGYQSVGRDITQRKEIEAALRNSEERYRAVVEDQTELIARHSPAYEMEFVNSALARYFSTSPEALVGKSFLPLLHTADRERVEAFYSSLTRESPIGTDEHRVLLRNGEMRWQQWNVRALFDETGERAGYQSVGRDITERKTIEDALRESEERYRIVTKHTADGIVVIQDQCYMFVNDAFAYMCGYDNCRQLTGKNISDIIDEAYREEYVTLMAALTSGQKVESVFRAKILRPDGRELWGEGLHTVIQWMGRPAVLATVRDATRTMMEERKTRRETMFLRQQNIKLAASMKDRYRLGNLVGKSHAMQRVYEQILSASVSDTNVVICGESGTGKELVAKAIHELSERSTGRLVPVNCGAIPENLMESEFFGHKRGAFTGADQDKSGYLDFAHNGTLFLDEVETISLSMQIKLLRAIEGGGHTPLGSNRIQHTDFRIIAATNRPLTILVREGQMREDFFYRIHIVPVHLPPLRERKEDIILLVEHFMREFTQGGEYRTLPGKLIDSLLAYDWPGNVRELQNVLQRYLTVGRLDFLPPTFADEKQGAGVPDKPITGKDFRTTVENFEKQLLLNSLEQHHWNRSKAAETLGLPRRTFYDKLQKLGVILHK